MKLECLFAPPWEGLGRLLFRKPQCRFSGSVAYSIISNPLLYAKAGFLFQYFEKVYNQLVEILKLETPYKLSEAENEALDLALKVSDEGDVYSHEDVVLEAQKKYPNLNFK